MQKNVNPVLLPNQGILEEYANIERIAVVYVADYLKNKEKNVDKLQLCLNCISVIKEIRKVFYLQLGISFAMKKSILSLAELKAYVNDTVPQISIEER